MELANKRILMILDAPYPRDIRVEKEVNALQAAGADVTLVCYRRKGEDLIAEYKGCKIVRSRIAVTDSIKGLVDIYNSVFFTNPILSKTLNKLQEEFDAVHAHDLPVTLTALKYAKKKRIPGVYDMHENYPDAMKIWFSWRKNPLIRFKNKLFFDHRRWFKREKEMVSKFDKILTVVEEMSQRIIDTHGVDRDKIQVVSNTEPRDLFQAEALEDKILDENNHNIVYVGSFGPHRGLDTVVEALPLIVQEIPGIQLTIVGTGNPDTVKHLKNLALKGSMSDSVKFTGQLPFEEAIEYMRTAFLNVIPHHSNGQNENGIPHKFFQILNSGYPLIVSSCRPMKRIIESNKAGIVFAAGNPTDFAEKVLWANNNRKELIERAKNGRELVQSKGFNWEKDGKALTNLYSELFNR